MNAGVDYTHSYFWQIFQFWTDDNDDVILHVAKKIIQKAKARNITFRCENGR